MTVDDKITDKKLEYNFIREPAKIPTLSSGKLINMNILHVQKYYFLIKVKC